MATNFPTSVDSFTNPTAVDTLDSPPHDQQHADANDAIEAIETALLDGAPLHIDDANERVGIGTATPSQPLHVYSSTGDVPVLVESGDSTVNLSLADSSTTTPANQGVRVVGNDLFLATSNTRRLTVTSSGNVGINDITPSYTLDVNGDINATGDLRIGGTAIGEWSTWSPTITPQTGSFTTVTVQFARYTVVNNLFIAQFRFTLTSVGTGNGVIYLTLPSGISLSNSGAIGGSWREQAVNGLTGVIQENGATSIDLNRYDNGVVIYAGARYSGTCTFEVA